MALDEAIITTIHELKRQGFGNKHEAIYGWQVAMNLPPYHAWSQRTIERRMRELWQAARLERVGRRCGYRPMVVAG